MATTTCPPALPSATSAMQLVEGDTSGIVPALSHTIIRGGLAGLGLASSGLRGKELVRGAIAATLAIELGVLLYMWHERGSLNKLPDRPRHMKYATLGSNTFLPAPSPTPGQVYSVPLLSGGYDYYRGPPGSSQPQNDDIPLPRFSHANPIGVAAISIGCAMSPEAVRIGSGKEARGCVTAMPGAKVPGVDAPMAMGPAMGSYGGLSDSLPQTSFDLLAAVAGLVVGFAIVKKMRR